MRLKNEHNGQTTQELNLVCVGKTYRHTLALRQWLLKKERSWSEQDREEE